MIEVAGFVEKVTSGVSKEGEIIIKITLAHNLTQSGVLSTAGDLIAMQDKPMKCSIELDQGTLLFKKRVDRIETG